MLKITSQTHTLLTLQNTTKHKQRDTHIKYFSKRIKDLSGDKKPQTNIAHAKRL